MDVDPIWPFKKGFGWLWPDFTVLRAEPDPSYAYQAIACHKELV